MTYRTLKRQFALYDEALDELEFVPGEGQEAAADKDGKLLVWTGDETAEITETATQTTDAQQKNNPLQPRQPNPYEKRPQANVAN